MRLGQRSFFGRTFFRARSCITHTEFFFRQYIHVFRNGSYSEMAFGRTQYNWYKFESVTNKNMSRDLYVGIFKNIDFCVKGGHLK